VAALLLPLRALIAVNSAVLRVGRTIAWQKSKGNIFIMKHGLKVAQEFIKNIEKNESIKQTFSRSVNNITSILSNYQICDEENNSQDKSQKQNDEQQTTVIRPVTKNEYSKYLDDDFKEKMSKIIKRERNSEKSFTKDIPSTNNIDKQKRGFSISR
jgi:hypothetical protein